MDGLLANDAYLIEWRQNQVGDVSRIPDLAPLPIRLAAKENNANGVLRGNVLYAAVRDDQGGGTVFQAVDVETGAVLGWWPVSQFYSSWVCADDGRAYARRRRRLRPRLSLVPCPAR